MDVNDRNALLAAVYALLAAVCFPIMTYYRIRGWWLRGRMRCTHGVSFRDECSQCEELPYG
jgi:hypothetical protein